MPRLIAMLGPSGAGKDSLLEHVRAHRPEIHIPERIITRPPHPDSEAWRSVDQAEFEALRRDGAFLFEWQAHATLYAIPSSCLEALAAGRTVLFNGSRAAFPMMRQLQPDLEGIWIEVAPAILAERLAARGRESAEAITARLARQTSAPPEGATSISNNGTLAEAGAALLEFLDR